MKQYSVSLTALLFLISSKMLISYCNETKCRVLTVSLIDFIFNLFMVLYLNVCNEVFLVYDQPVELVFQRRRFLDYRSDIVRGRKDSFSKNEIWSVELASCHLNVCSVQSTAQNSKWLKSCLNNKSRKENAVNPHICDAGTIKSFNEKWLNQKSCQFILCQ